MEAQAWTAIGLLAATLIGALFYLGNRIDALSGRMDSRFDALSGRMDSRFDAMDSRFDAMSGRIDGLAARVEEQGRELGRQIYALARILEEHLRRHAG